MHVAILIVAYRNAEDVSRCLQALATSSYRDFEVVICENGGADAFRRLLEIAPPSLPGGQIVSTYQADGNLGFAGGVNYCLQRSPSADAWWVLNPDTAPRSEALEAVVARLARGDCHAVGCTLYFPDGRVQSYGGRWEPWLARSISLGYGAPVDAAVDPALIERRQTYLNGAAMLIDRAFLQAVGEMREDYFLYCEESEWFERARRRGVSLGFAPEAMVLHAQGTTTGAGGAISNRPKLPVFLDERNKILMSRDCHPGTLAVTAFAALLQIVLRYGRRGAWRQVGYALAGWTAGLRNQRGRPKWAAG
jgi:GT2 family glycosyltransferase